MENKLEQIKKLVEEFLESKKDDSEWISYSGPSFGSEEYLAAIETLLDGWLVFGKKCNVFEMKFPRNLGKTMGALTNSGSSANLLMISALMSKNKCPKKYRLNKGDKLITPVVCFPTTINPLLQLGLEPVFVDVDIPSLNPNLDQVEELLKNDTNHEIKGIIFAHVLGNPPDMDRLMKLVDKYNLILLEDSCDALGSTYDGKKLGSFGLMSTCSFYPAHHMTMGEGGFIATDDAMISKTLKSIRDWGRACYCNEKKPGCVMESTACGNRFRPWFKKDKSLIYDHRYVFDEIGFNLKPLEIQAAIGLEQLKKIDSFEKARRDNFKKLSNIFQKYEDYFFLPKATEKADPCWFGFMPLVKENDLFNRHDFVQFLETNKIQTRPYFTGNIFYHPAYEYLDDGKNYPNADYATKNSIMMGTYIGIDDAKIKRIEKVVEDFFKSL
jgi:CDP-6-deoxy-D-xylo-4-hexulose-3-dehydrase